MYPFLKTGTYVCTRLRDFANMMVLENSLSNSLASSRNVFLIILTTISFLYFQFGNKDRNKQITHFSGKFTQFSPSIFRLEFSKFFFSWIRPMFFRSYNLFRLSSYLASYLVSSLTHLLPPLVSRRYDHEDDEWLFRWSLRAKMVHNNCSQLSHEIHEVADYFGQILLAHLVINLIQQILVHGMVQ